MTPDPPRAYHEELARGQDFERYVAEHLRQFGLDVGLYTTEQEQIDIGESRMGLEIKFDDYLARTKNLYFETHEKRRASNPQYVPSGVFRVDNAILYGIGNYHEFYIFGKRTLQRVYLAFERKLLPEDKDFQLRVTPTSRGITISRVMAKAWAERYWITKDDGTWSDGQAVVWHFRTEDLR